MGNFMGRKCTCIFYIEKSWMKASRVRAATEEYFMHVAKGGDVSDGSSISG